MATAKCPGEGCPHMNCAMRAKEHEIRSASTWGHRNAWGVWDCERYEMAKALNEQEPELGERRP